MENAKVSVVVVTSLCYVRCAVTSTICVERSVVCLGETLVEGLDGFDCFVLIWSVGSQDLVVVSYGVFSFSLEVLFWQYDCVFADPFQELRRG